MISTSSCWRNKTRNPTNLYPWRAHQTLCFQTNILPLLRSANSLNAWRSWKLGPWHPVPTWQEKTTSDDLSSGAVATHPASINMIRARGDSVDGRPTWCQMAMQHAAWGGDLICHLPPFRGTKNNHWRNKTVKSCSYNLAVPTLTQGEVTFTNLSKRLTCFHHPKKGHGTRRIASLKILHKAFWTKNLIAWIYFPRKPRMGRLITTRIITFFSRGFQSKLLFATGILGGGVYPTYIITMELRFSFSWSRRAFLTGQLSSVFNIPGKQVGTLMFINLKPPKPGISSCLKKLYFPTYVFQVKSLFFAYRLSPRSGKTKLFESVSLKSLPNQKEEIGLFDHGSGPYPTCKCDLRLTILISKSIHLFPIRVSSKENPEMLENLTTFNFSSAYISSHPLIRLFTGVISYHPIYN